MDIGKMSMSLSQTKLKQEAGGSVMKMILDSARGEAAGIEKLMEANQEMERMVSPHLGASVDIKA